MKPSAWRSGSSRARLLAFVARLYSVLGSHGVRGRIKRLQIFLARRTPSVDIVNGLDVRR